MNSRRNFLALPWILLGALLFSILPRITLPAVAAAQDLTQVVDTPHVNFTWAMPARFGLDEDGDGLIDYFTTPETISPERWSVDVNACDSQSDEPTIVTFRWSVLGLPDIVTESCTASLTFPEQGRYNVTLTTITDQGTEASITQSVTVRDWLIVSLGDSYASGEGVPDGGFLPGFSAVSAAAVVPPSENSASSATLLAPEVKGELVKWQDAAYHRSANAGPAVAARLLEEGDPHSSVTFVHLARANGHLFHDDPERTDLNMSTQITQALSLIGARQIDALLLSIGGNDAGFARLIKTCMALDRCYEAEFELIEEGLANLLCQPVSRWTGVLARLKEACIRNAADIDDEIREFTAEWTKNAAEIFAERVEPLPERYDALVQNLEQLNIRDDGIFIVEYANATRQDSSDFCPQENNLNNLPGFSESEFRWAEEELLNHINSLIEDAAQRNGWTYVGGIADGFAQHGYCADENWIVRIPESLRVQLDLSGVLHPDEAGYAYTGQQIVQQVLAKLAPIDFTLYIPFHSQSVP